MLTNQMTDDSQTSVQGMNALPSPSTFNPTVRPKRRPVDATAPPSMAPAPLKPPATPAVGATPVAPAPMQGGIAATIQAGAGSAPPASTLPAPAAVAPPPLTNPGGIVPTTPIDPANDLRSSAVLPTSTPALDRARTGLVDATSGLTGFDRLGTLKSIAGSVGADITGGPSEQGALDTLNGQVAGAAGKVAGYDRNTDVAGLRDSLAQFFGPTDVQAGAGVSTAPSDRLSKYNTLLDDSAGKLAGVDRVAMAKDLLAQFDDQQLPEHELALRNLTKQYVAKGGGKSGMVRTAYGNEDLVRQRDRDAMKKSLISAALEGSIQDQFNKTSALSNLQSGTAAQDAGVRGEQRTDRGYATDVATGNVDRGLATKAAIQSGASAGADSNYATKTGAAGLLGSLQGATASREAARRDSGRSFAAGLTDAASGDASRRTAASQNLFDTLTQEGQAQRAETRGERGYQNDLESQSYGRGMTELQLEQQQKQAETARQLALLAAGEGGNPSGTLTSLANGAGGLDPQLIAQLAATLGQKSASGSATGAPGATLPGTTLPLPSGITLPDYGGIFS